MKILIRRIGFLIIALSVILGTISFPNFTVVAGDNDYVSSFEVLKRLNILNAEDASRIEGGNPVTKAEFIAIVINSMGMEKEALTRKGKTDFSDVPDVHPNSGAINIAKDMGLISGDDKNRLFPDDKLSYGEAIKILVTMTGNHLKIPQQNMNINSYIFTDTSNKIMKNVGTVDFSSPVITSNLIIMLKNTLEIDMLIPTKFGEILEYKTIDGRNIMSEYLHIKKNSGLVTGINTTKINQATTLRDEEIEIDGIVYEVTVDKNKIADLLGCKIIFYTRITNLNDKLEILYMEEIKNNNIMVLKNTEIQNNTTNKKIYYNLGESSNIETVEIPLVANIVINGVYAGKAHMIENKFFKPNSGYVKLIDYDNSGKYGLIIIKYYEEYVVENINVNSEIIIDYYKRDTLDLSNVRKLKITKKGKSISFADIQVWDVLSVERDIGRNYVNVYVTSNKVSGTVTEYDNKSINIDGEKYEFSLNYLEVISGDINGDNSVKLGDNYSFYLDSDGKIAAADVGGKGGNNYAYYIDSVMTGISNTLKIKILDKSGQFLILKVDEKVKLDGISKVTMQNVYTVLNTLEKLRPIAPRVYGTASIDKEMNENVPKQNRLISYKLSDSGVIKEIDTVIDNAEENGKGLKIAYSNYYKRYKAYMKFSGGDGNFVFNNNTVMLNIPYDKTDEKGYSAGNKFSHDQFFYVTAYEKEDGIVKIIVNFKKNDGSSDTSDNISSNVSSDKSLAVVDKVSTVLDENGNTVPKIYMLNGGKLIEKICIADRIIPELHRGDIIRFDTNSYDEINALKILFQPWVDKSMAITDAGGGDEKIYGIIYRKMPEVVEMTTKKDVNPENETDFNPYLIKRFSKIYVYDEIRDKVFVGSANDIFDFATFGNNASTAFMKIRYDDPKEMVIYRWKETL